MVGHGAVRVPQVSFEKRICHRQKRQLQLRLFGPDIHLTGCRHPSPTAPLGSKGKQCPQFGVKKCMRATIMGTCTTSGN